MSVRDNLIFHALPGLEGSDSLGKNPFAGSSKEGYAVENIMAGHEHWKLFF